MKRKAMMVTMFFTAGILAAGAAFAAEDASRDASKYGTSSSDMTRSGMDSSSQSATSGSQEQQSSQTAAASGEQQGIQSAEDLKNFTVVDSQNQRLGKVSQVLIDLQSGRLGYAVVSSGGMFGMGGDKYIVPFSALKPGTQNQTFTLDVQKDQLQRAPEGDLRQALDRERGREIHQFYGVSPYWEESGSQSQPQDSSSRQDMMEERESEGSSASDM